MRRFDLLAKAVYQLQIRQLTDSIREQARSHIIYRIPIPLFK